MAKNNSYQTILRSSAIIGTSTVLNIFIGFLRMKIVAVLLGPAGVGLIGLFTNLVSVMSLASSLGYGTVGTRRIAASLSKDDQKQVETVVSALFWGTLILSLFGAVIFLALRSVVASEILLEPDRQTDITWLALGVVIGVLLTFQTAVFTGYRQIGNLAKVRIFAGLFGLIGGVASVWFWGANGIVFFVLSLPLAQLIIGWIFLRRLPSRSQLFIISFSNLRSEWRASLPLGLMFMISGLVCLAGDLAVRTIILRQLGTDDLGHFQVIWTISIASIGFIMGAMMTDYYPRLSAEIEDREKAKLLINQQTEVAMLLCVPMLLFGIGFAPWMIQLLYSSEFLPATNILRVQFISDVLRVMAWPLAITLMAAQAGKLHIFTEVVGSAIMVLFVYFTVSELRLYSIGFGSLAKYLFYMPLVWVIVRHLIGFRWSPLVVTHSIAAIVGALLVFATAQISENLAAGTGLILAVLFGLFGLVRLAKMTELEGRLGLVLTISQRLLQVLRIPH